MDWILVKDQIPGCDEHAEFLAYDGTFIHYCSNWTCSNCEDHFDKEIECFYVWKEEDCFPASNFTHWIPLPKEPN